MVKYIESKVLEPLPYYNRTVKDVLCKADPKTCLAEEFTAITAKCDKLIVIDFTASWCGPCKTIAPVFEQCSKDFPNAEFYKVDVDDLSDVAEQCGIRAMPTFIFYKNGQRIDDLRGANTTELKAKIKRHCS